MIRILITGIFLFLNAYVSAAEKERKCVFIIADGIPADVIERVSTPTIDEISRQGSYTRAQMGGRIEGYSQTPTVSAVCYNTLITGTWVNKHNVWDNSISNPNYRYWSIFRTAENQKRDVRTAIFSSWQDNRTKLVGEGLPQTATPKIDYVLDTLEHRKDLYPDEPNSMNIFKIDEAISKAAAETIRGQAPDLTWVYLWYMDCVGHEFGNGERFDEYTEKTDRQIDRIWKAVQYREANFNEEWLIVVITDHGRQQNGYGHGGQTPRERTVWIAMNQPLNQYGREKEPETVDVYPTICRFMGFEMPVSARRELDGTPLIGPTSISQPEALPDGDRIRLTWTPGEKKSTVKIYAALENQYTETGEEKWLPIGKANSESGEFIFDTRKYPSKFYKFLLETPHNSVNVWVQPEK